MDIFGRESCYWVTLTSSAYFNLQLWFLDFDGLVSVLMVTIYEIGFVYKMAGKCLLGRWSSSLSKATCSLAELKVSLVF